MPLWMEVLLNVIGYGGFVAIAIYHRPSGDDLPTDEALDAKRSDAIHAR